MIMTNYKDLGYLNEWFKNPPEEVTKCVKENHKKKYQVINSKCITVVWCDICKYKYKIDSSD